MQGNDVNYYDARNSLLPAMLTRRRGIPITLCLLHCVVAQRAGLPVRMLGCPGHVVNKCARPGCSPDDVRYIDVFNSGRVMAPQQFE